MSVICVYCGDQPGKTRDHVPPKNLFPRPRPVNMMTVPSCEKCQAKFKKDEDVFMAWITFGPAGDAPKGKLLWEQKLKRTYKKDRGLKNVIAKSLKKISLETPGGLYLGEKVSISIDRRRRNNVLCKIIRGLFWVEYRERLPKEISMQVYGINAKDKRINELIAISEQATTFWEGIFEYRHVRETESFESYWIMSFFRRNYFIVVVAGRENGPL